MLLQFGVSSDCVAQKEVDECGSQYYVGRVYLWYGGEGSFEAPVHFHRWAGHGCVDQAIVQGEVCVLQRQAWCGPLQEGVMIDRLDSGDSEHNRVWHSG